MPRESEENPFVEDIPVYDRFLLSGYDQIEYLDFRLNEARTLPTEVERRISSDQPLGTTRIKLVAFLTAVPVSSELSVANTEFHKMRLLEYAIWSAYAPGLPRGMVVYHWKKSAPPSRSVDSFSAFVKLQTRHSGSETLLKYLLFAFAFGIFGNLVAGWAQPYVTDILLWVWSSSRGAGSWLISNMQSIACHIVTLWKSHVPLLPS